MINKGLTMGCGLCNNKEHPLKLLMNPMHLAHLHESHGGKAMEELAIKGWSHILFRDPEAAKFWEDKHLYMIKRKRKNDNRKTTNIG